MTADLTVVTIAYNESLHIARMIASVRPIAKRVVIVDSGSTDGTVQIARDLGAEVLHHSWKNHADQFQWGLDNAAIDSEWTMRLDADEIIEADLQREIAEKLPALPPDVTGINLDRKHIFMDRWVRFGGRYPLRMIRIWRTGRGRIEQRWMDEHIIVDGGRIIAFRGGFADHNLKDLTFFTAKHNDYATREAIDVLNRRYAFAELDHGLTKETSSRQVGFKRWVKEKIYNRIPFELSATAYLLYRLIIQLGLLDGRRGIAYHVLQGFWYRFLVGAKIRELEELIPRHAHPERIRAILSDATGLSIEKIPIPKAARNRSSPDISQAP